MSNRLEHLKEAQFSGVKSLADAVERILRSSDSSQNRGTVAEYPNERTIRYYITEGLLPAPVDKRGPSSVYGYEHLLTLLLIKKLQAKRIPISVIKTLIADKAVEELEKLLGEEVQVFTNQEDLDRYREAIGHRDDSEVRVFAETGPPEPTENNEAQEYLESLLLSAKPRRSDDSDIAFSRPAAPPSMPALAARSPRSPSEPQRPNEPVAWRRYQIADGLELNVRDNFEPPNNTDPLKQIIQRILKLIGRK